MTGHHPRIRTGDASAPRVATRSSDWTAVLEATADVYKLVR